MRTLLDKYNCNVILQSFSTEMKLFKSSCFCVLQLHPDLYSEVLNLTLLIQTGYEWALPLERLLLSGAW